MIDKTKNNQSLPYYYYILSSIKFYHQQPDSSLYYLNKSLVAANQYNVSDIKVHSTISIGVMNMIVADSLAKYLSDYLKLGYENSLKTDDYFAKAAGAWSMIEYHLQNSKNEDSILYYRKLSFNYLKKLPNERITLKNFGIKMTENFVLDFFSNNHKNSKKITREALNNIKNANNSNFNLKLINFDEILNSELMYYYSLANQIDSAINIGLQNYNNIDFHQDFIHIKWQYANHLSSLFEKKADYKNALKYHKESVELSLNFVNKNESLRRISKLRELESINYQNKLTAKQIQQQLIFSIIFVVLLVIGVIFYVLLNRYKKIQSLNRKLDEANDAKNKLFRVISHDLSAPVNSTISLSEQLELYKEKMSKDDILITANLIYKSTNQLKSLLTTLFEWSKLNLNGFAGANEKIDVNNVIENALKDLSYLTIAKNIEIEIKVIEDLDIVFNKESLRVVLRNLLSNAIKFSPKNGKIIIELNKNSLAIQDSGNGFPEEILGGDLNKIQSKAGTNNENGLGVGLKIVKDICDAHNTKISFENIHNIGAKVKLEF